MHILAAATSAAPTLSGGGLVAAAGVLLCWLAFGRRRRDVVTLRSPGRSLAVFGRGFGRLLLFVFRFCGGRELWGEPRSTAGFFRTGTPVATRKRAAVSMAAVAHAQPRVNLVKNRPRARRPRPWARKVAGWVETYSGRGAKALDYAVRTAVWTAYAAGKTWRALKAVWRALRAVYGVVAPIVRVLARGLRLWHCWPYAARGITRLALTAAAVGLTVPAWRTETVVLLVLAAAGAVTVAWYCRPEPPGDDATYGPRIWAILRDDLKLPDDEPRQEWLLLPPALKAPDARIVIRLPWTWRGSELDRETLTALVNSRLPGEWVARVTLTGETFTAVYTHKPPPKPPATEPVPPDRVSFFDADIQEAIAACKKGEIVLGKDAFGQIIVREMGDGETPHWALSVGSGGGKSALCQMVIAQLIAQRYYIISADVKRVSVSNYIGVPGCYIYNDPMNPQDMREGIDWFREEISARSAISEADPTAEFPGILCLIEEANEFADISREWWDDNRKVTKDEFGPADRAADPIWGTVASGARLGRHVHGNILAVFQDLRDQALGGKGLRNLFRLKLLGNYSTNTWKNVVGTTPVPPSVDKAGRMMVVEGNSKFWMQVCYGSPEELRAWSLAARERTGFVEGAGLYGTAPKPSPKRLPTLLQGLSRDELPEALREPSEGSLSNETAGGLSHEGTGVTASEDDVTAQRDRLRLIPGQGSRGPAHDATAPPELLLLAEIARRVGPDQGVPKYDTLRAHKGRRDDFPKGVEINGKEHFTVSQILAYYTEEEARA